MKKIFLILVGLCFIFPIIFFLLAKFTPEFLLSLPSPFSDFRSAPVALWIFIIFPLMGGIFFFILAHFFDNKKAE